MKTFFALSLLVFASSICHATPQTWDWECKTSSGETISWSVLADGQEGDNSPVQGVLGDIQITSGKKKIDFAASEALSSQSEAILLAHSADGQFISLSATKKLNADSGKFSGVLSLRVKSRSGKASQKQVRVSCIGGGNI